MASRAILYTILILGQSMCTAEKISKEAQQLSLHSGHSAKETRQLSPYQQEQSSKEARHLSRYQPGQGYHYYGDYVTCTCGVLGPSGPIKQQLEAWVDSDYYSQSGYDQPLRRCTARACYRADFIGVSEYGSYNNRGHYVVLGCMDPQTQASSLGRQEIVEFTIRQNVSISELLSNYAGGYHRARLVLEFLCTHYECQNLDPTPWLLHNYYWKMQELCRYSSASRYLANGLAGMIAAVISLIYAQRSI